jgi:hypothetical protein
MKHPNMQSSVNEYGETVTQIIHFSSGNKRTYHGVLTNTIKQGQFTKFKLKSGAMLLINDNNVDCIEVFPENNLDN